jgi:competence protein ComEC
MQLFWLSLAWLAGLALGRALALPAWAWLPPLALGGGAVYLLTGRLRWLAGGWLIACLGALRFAVAQPTLDTAHLSSHNDSGEAVVLTGVVVDFPDVRDTHIGLRVRAERLRRIADPLSVPARGLALVRASRYQDFAYGDRVQAIGMLETPPVFEGFSYREYLARQGVYSLMSPARVTRLAAGQANPLLQAVFALRQRALRTVQALFPEPESSLLAGILLGVESGIHPALRQAFNDTSTTHIIAISGFNITLLAGLVITLFGRWLGPRRGAMLAALAIGLYAVMVGADPAVLRAAIMGGLSLYARLLGRQTQALASLGAAALAMTALSPLTLWDVGFQLSFAATLGLVLYADPISQRFTRFASRWMDSRRAERLARPVGEFGLFTLAAQATTLPLTAYYFKRLSLVSLVANPAILPAQPALMVLGGLSVLLGMLWLPLGQLVAWAAWPFPAYTLRAVEFFAGLPSASLALPSFGLLAAGLGYAALFGITLAPRELLERLRPRRLGLAIPRPLGTAALVVLGLGTGLTWKQVADRPDGRTHLTILDVGEGEAALIQTPTGRFVLVGGGPSPISLAEALGRRLPLFHRRLDWLLLAGTAEEQVAGLVRLVERYPVGQAWVAGTPGGAGYRRVLDELREAAVPIRQAQSGAALDLGDGALLEAVAVGQRGAALLLTHGRLRALLAPGADPEMVQGLMQDPELTALTAALLPDGGYLAVNPIEWLEQLSPGVVILSLQAGDPRGLPSPEVADWLEGRSVLRTDRDGWIELITDGEQFWVQAERAPVAGGP